MEKDDEFARNESNALRGGRIDIWQNRKETDKSAFTKEVLPGQYRGAEEDVDRISMEDNLYMSVCKVLQLTSLSNHSGLVPSHTAGRSWRKAKEKASSEIWCEGQRFIRRYRPYE